jgi:pimeloyl-ACP methyl ester carboxylesterase
MTHFVLVHGAWGGGWVWDDVAARLRRDGHRVTVVAQLPSGGTDPAALGDLAADAEVVRAEVRAAGGPVVLVGHSYGGMVITELADEPAVAALVYVAAFRPQRGASLLDGLGEGPLPPWIVPRDDDSMVVTDDVETVRAHLCPELSLEQAQQFMGRLGLQGTAAFASPSSAPAAASPVTYVVCEQDRAIPPEAQEAMAAGADRVVRLPAPHMVQFTMPDRLADELEAAAAAVSRPPVAT